MKNEILLNSAGVVQADTADFTLENAVYMDMKNDLAFMFDTGIYIRATDHGEIEYTAS